MITWRERIAAAKARGAFTEDEVRMAANWDSCAVGEQGLQHPLVVRFRQDEVWRGPADDRLYLLGCSEGFASAVGDHDFDRADRLLDAIQDRTLTLKREHQDPGQEGGSFLSTAPDVGP